jgi:hypothetical protein
MGRPAQRHPIEHVDQPPYSIDQGKGKGRDWKIKGQRNKETKNPVDKPKRMTRGESTIFESPEVETFPQ